MESKQEEWEKIKKDFLESHSQERYGRWGMFPKEIIVFFKSKFLNQEYVRCKRCSNIFIEQDNEDCSMWDKHIKE